jgi:predicted RNase H-like HicB family nuclease
MHHLGRLTAGSGYTAKRGQLATESSMQLTAVYRKVPEGYVAFVEELPGANTQGASLDEARANLVEAVDLVLDANRVLSEESIQGQDVIREPLIIAAQ